VKAVRESWDWTQGGLASAIGAPRSTVNRIENGHAKQIEPDVILRLAEMFETTTDHLLRDSLEVPASAYKDGVIPDSE